MQGKVIPTIKNSVLLAIDEYTVIQLIAHSTEKAGYKYQDEHWIFSSVWVPDTPGIGGPGAAPRRSASLLPSGLHAAESPLVTAAVLTGFPLFI